MTKRRPLPDPLNVMDALQGVQTKPMKLGELSEGISEEGRRVFAPAPAAKLEERKTTPASSAAKSKINLYMSKVVKRRIEQAQVGLRNLAPEGLDGQINYSLIVETAVNLALEDFERSGEDSLMCREIMAQLRRK